MERIFVTLSALLCAFSITQAEYLKFTKHYEDDVYEFINFLKKPFLPERFKTLEFFQKAGLDHSKRLTAFSFKNCGGMIDVRSLSVQPDPLQFPGTITFSASAALNTTLSAPLNAKIELKKKAAGIWVPLPCIDQIGSCSYGDICQLLEQITQCPPQLTAIGIDCKCPIKAGKYTLPSMSQDIGAEAFPSGDYEVTGTVTDKDGKVAACLEVQFEELEHEFPIVEPEEHDAYLVDEHQMKLNDESELLMDLLFRNALPERFRGEDYFKTVGIKKSSRVEAFQWQNCGNNDPATVMSLSVTPDPLQFPGTVNIAGKLQFNSSFAAPLPASLVISKKAAGVWIKLPCIDNFGSCDYPDLCQILSSVGDCPDPITSSGLGCQCPFKSGTFDVNGVSFDVDASAFPSGDYKIRGSLTTAGKEAACVEIIITIS
ncbi:uncharacterized protein LOC128155172 [Crassostrea angulata]|uniref:Ganglioside GM2 activator n=1 Tax=Magallana gigas TaxID=29159 RepID=K1QVY2_MAGGI|nr:uncharacterized protein LOC128155172 [Crassostrea angulata]